ncbi:homocysteine biosynthesis protein [Desulfohalobiaceae bacterium Ax17]|uniref:homocysteine biosynthesis protein n=1 Tax=Desulfovulcanus ferrireducens TaxID=2831190 RepID=UPI00207BBF33|nr:homocysteine biosynthesis protein [Desulfovulcanus ferrireducens]MBT8763490.1 homocysteine biosynthesis protein [Desulfovulcanus ferrireducens]
MAIKRTISEINDKIKKGKAVVLNAREMAKLVREKGKKKAAQEVDVVTTGTFSPMCSSGMLFNFGHQPPLIKASKVWLNGVPSYAGLAAVDAYLGVTEPAEDDPLNKVYPGQFKYGGGHVIEELVRGKSVRLKAIAYGTDCYPRRELEKDITLAELKDAILLNPRNCYQNYNCAVNKTNKIIYTYMGPLRPNLGNLNFATSGELSPLFNDPYFKTIGLGTKILLGGGIGYVIGAGTQHNPNPVRNKRGIPMRPSGTLMVKGDLKQMNARFLRGVSIVGYGCSMAVGVGIPIPILNEEMAWYTGVSDEDIQMPVIDYGVDYGQGKAKVIKYVTYAELKSGQVEVEGKKVSTVPVTSYALSLEVADLLKEWIESGEFLLTEAQEKIESN